MVSRIHWCWHRAIVKLVISYTGPTWTTRWRIVVSHYSIHSMYKCLIDKINHPPAAVRNLVAGGIDESKLSAIFELPFKITQESKLRDFQYRISHNIIVCNARLYKLKLVDSDRCRRCHTEKEDLRHLLIECPLVAALWSDILYFGMQQFQQSARHASHEILYVYKPNERKFSVNCKTTCLCFHALLDKLEMHSKRHN